MESLRPTMDFSNRRFWRRPDPLVRDDKSGDDKRNGNKQEVGSLYRDHKIGSAYDKMGSMTGKTGTTTDKRTTSTRTDDHKPQQKNAVKIGSLYDNKKIIWM